MTLETKWRPREERNQPQNIVFLTSDRPLPSLQAPKLLKT